MEAKGQAKEKGGKVSFWHRTCKFCFRIIDQWNLVTVKMWEIKNNKLSSENNVLNCQSF